MGRSMEFALRIGGNLDGSLKSAFTAVKSNLKDLKTEARNTERAINSLNKDFKAGRISQEDYARGTRNLNKELARLHSAERKRALFENGKQKVQQTVKTAKTVAGIAAVGAAATGTKLALDSLNTAAEFEAEITKGGVKMEATRSEMDRLSKTALELSSNSKLTAIQVAQAMDEMAAKGLNANQTIAAMPGVIAGAEASGEDLALVADTTMSAVNAFGLGAGATGRVADIMAMAANKTAAGVEDMGYSFKYAAPVAKTLGISIEELAGATGLMVDKGLAGEQAGTALRMALKRLASPPKDARKQLDALGISAVDSKGKFKSLGQITEDWTEKTKSLSDVQKVAAANTIFGAEAASAMLAYFDTGPTKINEMTKALENSEGAAASASQKMKDNFAGSKTTLISTVEAAKIAFAKPMLPVGRQIMDSISAGIKANFGTIEKAGEQGAKVLETVFNPFIKKKPVLTPEIKSDPEAMAQYVKDLNQYNSFQNMDFGDKVIYGLDQVGAKMEEWLNGSGGDTVTRIFEKLGEMAAKAWATAFTRAATSAVESAMSGNIAGAVSMGALAWSLGGGALVKGGGALLGKGGKFAYDKFKNKGGKGGGKGGGGGGTPITPTNEPKSQPKKPKAEPKAQPVTATAKEPVKAKTSFPNTVKEFGKSTKETFTNFGKKMGGFFEPLGKAGKWLGKAGGPLALLGGGLAIATADDKKKESASVGGGLAGGAAGAATGAAIGSVIPGLGTAIGGVAGGILGSMGGSAVGEKIYSWFKPSPTTATAKEPAPQPAPQPQGPPQPVADTATQTAATQGNTQLSASLTATQTALTSLQEKATSASQHMGTLATGLGQASGWVNQGFAPLQTAGSMIDNNMSILTSYLGQASGWVNEGFYPLSTASAMTISNLELLTSYVGQACGWVNSLSGIQDASANVIASLNSLKARIDTVELPSGKGGRTAYE